MCKFIGKSNKWILCKLSKRGIFRLYSIVHIRLFTLIFTCQSKSFISIFFTCQVSACELQPFSCHHLANDFQYTHKLPKLCSATSFRIVEDDVSLKNENGHWYEQKYLLFKKLYYYKCVCVYSFIPGYRLSKKLLNN